MTPGELRGLVMNAPIYKMSLGKASRYEQEALNGGVLVFQSEAAFYRAVMSGFEGEIRRTGRLVINAKYPKGGAKDDAIRIWRRTIGTFDTLCENVLIVHWEAKYDHLHWGITGPASGYRREEIGDWGQTGIVFHHPLTGGWKKASIAGVSLSNMHPKARALAINRATLDAIVTDTEYFRALITDKDTTEWELRPDWQKKAKATGWIPKDRNTVLAAKRQKLLTPLVQETADFFEAEIARMAQMALHTAAYANGQTVLTTIKAKDIGFTREELEAEIAALLLDQDRRCALTGYEFKANASNPHLRTSLDRKDSSLGYVPGNLQVVTRAANFYKSASDTEDWKLKAHAMERMAIAMQRARKQPTESQ